MKASGIKVSVLTGLLVSLLLLGACAGEVPFRFGPWELGVVFSLPISMGVYFLPTIIAAVRQKRKMLGVVLLNALAGWTVVGWIIALVWAFAADC